jgi:[ribosomal protein S18]-alanine N-acetyltransferase
MLLWGKPAPSRLVSMRGEHAEDCAAIHAGAFAHGWSAGEVEALLAGFTAFGAVALDPAGPDLRGFVLSRQAADEAEILTIAVASSWRGLGVGRELLAEHLRQAALRGARMLFLEVDPDNAPALALYRRFGFAKVGERKGYYRKPSGVLAPAWIMRRELA